MCNYGFSSVPFSWNLQQNKHPVLLSCSMALITIRIATAFLIFFRIIFVIVAAENAETRPYEFSFNIQDFQHRYEKKDSEGIVTGEYGFITADGVYHETGYATDKNGNFLITKMRNRKITSLEVAQEIFKGKPEVAKRVIQVLAKSCSGCGIPVHKGEDKNEADKPEDKREENKNAPVSNEIDATLAKMSDVLSREAAKKQEEITSTSGLEEKLNTIGELEREEILRKMIAEGRKVLRNEISADDPRGAKSLPIGSNIIEKMAEDLFYRFNYTITSHGHQESGYRDGNKDGSYRSQGINNTDAKVDYLSNEFGHQPNITFVYREKPRDSSVALKGFSFEWIYDKK